MLLPPGKNGNARLLADAGYASLRFEKRVAGPHAEENMQILSGSLSMQSHREECAGVVELMATMSEIRTGAAGYNAEDAKLNGQTPEIILNWLGSHITRR